MYMVRTGFSVGTGRVEIDASGTLPDGMPFADVAEFRAALLVEPWSTEFVSTVT